MDEYMAVIKAFGFYWAPQGWLTCSGQIMSITQNSALYSLLGTNFGGNGMQTFGIPDLRGRTIIGADGASAGLTNRTFGSMGGTETVALAVNEMPAHTHSAQFTGTSVTVKASSAAGVSGIPGARNTTLGACSSNLYNGAAPDITLNTGGGAVTGTVALANAGQNVAHNNMQPFTVLNYCIATEGIYPSRP